MIPIRVFESETFKIYCECMDPSYPALSLKIMPMSASILNHHKMKVAGSLISLFQSAPYVCLTLDLWFSCQSPTLERQATSSRNGHRSTLWTSTRYLPRSAQTIQLSLKTKRPKSKTSVMILINVCTSQILIRICFLSVGCFAQTQQFTVDDGLKFNLAHFKCFHP